jgi:hypothetical protein
LGIVLQVGLILGDHIPDNNSELSGSGSCSCVSAFSVSDPLEKRSEGMVGLISDAVGCIS